MTTRVVRLERLSPQALDDYLAQGWFRIGQTLMTCRLVLFDGVLRTALWTRLPLEQHRFRRSSRKLLSRNRRHFQIAFHDHARLDDEHESLYQRYRAVARGERSPSLEDFLYGDSDPVGLFDTREVSLSLDGRLVAFSWFDLGEDSSQSLMGVYEPSLSSHSLGFTTMLLEIEYSMQRGLRWFYPGYVLPGEPAMDYKLRVGDVQFRDAPPINTYEVGAFPVAAGERFATTCSWHNDTDAPLTFPTEMCATVGFAYPLTVPIVCDPGRSPTALGAGAG